MGPGVSQKLWPKSQVRSCPAGTNRREQYPVKFRPSVKSGQLSCLASTYFSQQSSKQEEVAVYILRMTRGSKGLLPEQACL